VLVGATARGLAGAMMMTAVRQVTTELGLLKETPPATMFREGTPDAADRMPPGAQAAITEFAHWAYGAGGGTVFALLPGAVRRHPAAGPVYGLALWAGFETVLAPLLGVRHAQGRLVGRAMVVLDHLLYGIVVAPPWPTVQASE